MTTFAKKTFDAAAYLRNRPTYTASFINHVIDYAKPSAKSAVALDLGCGPGQATALLAASGAFSKVIGLDPSKGMIAAAQSTSPAALLAGEKKQDVSAEVEYKVGSAEDLGWLEKDSIDLVTAGQAAHWFDHPKAYGQIHRILKPGGTVAYWGYSYLFLPEYPKASSLVSKFGLETLKGYWEPGRIGPDSLYDAVPFPTDTGAWEVSSFRREKHDQTDSPAYTPSKDLDGPPTTQHFPICMRKGMDLESLHAQLKTWSSVHTYNEKHKGTCITEQVMKELRKEIPEKGEFKVEWPVGLLLMKKRQ